MKRKELMNAIEKAIAVAKNETEIGNQADLIHFNTSEIVVYSDLMTISVPFDTELKCSVKASSLLDIVNSIEMDEINIKQEKNKLVFNFETNDGIVTTAQLTSFNSETSNEWPELPEKWHKLNKDFLDGVTYVMDSTDKGRSFSNILSTIYIDKNAVIASDNTKISTYFFNDTCPIDLILPSEFAKKIVDFELEFIAVDKAWIHFKTTNDVIISYRKITLEYPEQIVELGKTELNGTELKLTGNFKKLIDNGKIFSKQEDGSSVVSITITKNKIVCSSSASTGKVVSETKVKYDGEKISFNINPKLLEKMFKMSNPYIVHSDSKIEITTENIKYLIALMV